jgi:hypothetical protein
MMTMTTDDDDGADDDDYNAEPMERRNTCMYIWRLATPGASPEQPPVFVSF